MRVRNESGTKRVQIKSTALWDEFLVQVRAVLSLPTESLAFSLEPSISPQIKGSRRHLTDLGIVNGVLLYLKVSSGTTESGNGDSEMECASPMDTTHEGLLNTFMLKK